MGRPLNVLVYSGTGASAESVRHTLATLRLLLAPNYAVIPIAELALLKEPWEPSCAAIVFPGGRDLGYGSALNGYGNERIRNFVRHGGAYIGFCAGAYYASKKCEFEVGNPELEVVGARELGFFPGTCRGGAFKGFRYGEESGARTGWLFVDDKVWGIRKHPDFTGFLASYYNGGGVFLGADTMEAKGVEVLAHYNDHVELDLPDTELQPAAVYCQVEHGSAILFGTHPEYCGFNMDQDRYSTNPSAAPNYSKMVQEIRQSDAARLGFLKRCLSKLGLEVDSEQKTPPQLTDMHLSSLRPEYKTTLLQAWKQMATGIYDGEENIIEAEHDKFSLKEATGPPEKPEKTSHQEYAADMAIRGANTSGRGGTPDHTADFDHLVKRIVYHDKEWPSDEYTRRFSHSKYYNSLEKAREDEKLAGSKWKQLPVKRTWGNVFMYGSVLTSTNSLLDKNPKLLSTMQSGFTLAATTQVAGRGRGTNVWVAPAGSLLFSTVINHPAAYAVSRPIVFIQYLAAIAIVQAIKSYSPESQHLPVKLKWPNDILARDPTEPDREAYVKIGGILSTCSYDAGTYQIVLGIGVNVNNPRPTTSLDALMRHHLSMKNNNSGNFEYEPFSIESLIARILVRLEALHTEFMAVGFSQEMHEAYYQHWLHSDQIVTLDAHGVQGRIVGITNDWGMLKVDELEKSDDPKTARTTGKRWALRSDENSFDFWQGLIRSRIP
ncbi:biotin--protein ligase [Naviculisporaceae sp. PSN 640]